MGGGLHDLLKFLLHFSFHIMFFCVLTMVYPHTVLHSYSRPIKRNKGKEQNTHPSWVTFLLEGKRALPLNIQVALFFDLIGQNWLCSLLSIKEILQICEHNWDSGNTDNRMTIWWGSKNFLPYLLNPSQGYFMIVYLKKIFFFVVLSHLTIYWIQVFEYQNFVFSCNSFLWLPWLNIRAWIV